MPRTLSTSGGRIIIGDPKTDEMLQYLEDMDGLQIKLEVEIEAQFIDGATPAAARWIAAINSLFPQITSIGVTSVRNIAGTSTLSQHAFGNATDVFAPWPVMDQIFDFGVANAAIFSIRLLILRDVQWYGGGLGTYGGIYHNHVHTDFYPQYPI